MYPPPPNALPAVARSLCLNSDAVVFAERQRLDAAILRTHPLRGSWSRPGYIVAGLYALVGMALPGAVPGFSGELGGTAGNIIFNVSVLAVFWALVTHELMHERSQVEALPHDVSLRDMARGHGPANHFLDRLARIRKEHVVADLQAVRALLS